jgi:hypothetical protein
MKKYSVKKEDDNRDETASSVEVTTVSIDEVAIIIRNSPRICALVDEDKTVVLSNNLDLMPIRKNIANNFTKKGDELEAKASCRVTFGDAVYSVAVTPVVYTKKGEENRGYILDMFTGENVSLLLRAAEEKIDQILQSVTQGINQIINISTFFESSILVDTPLTPADKTQHIDLIDSLLYASCRLLTQSQNITALFTEVPGDSHIRIGELMDVIEKECKDSLEMVGRKLVYGKVDSNCLVRMSERRFTLMMMNLMQNALLYSPAQSTISVDLTYEQNFAVIEVANFVEPAKQVQSRYSERAGLGLMVVRSSAEQAHGSFSAVKKDEFFVAKLRLPINHEPGVYALSSRFRDYTSERFKPVHLFLSEILRKESNNQQR